MWNNLQFPKQDSSRSQLATSTAHHARATSQGYVISTMFSIRLCLVYFSYCRCIASNLSSFSAAVHYSINVSFYNDIYACVSSSPRDISDMTYRNLDFPLHTCRSWNSSIRKPSSQGMGRRTTTQDYRIPCHLWRSTRPTITA